jgi:glycosyltransferase involved in cell wall biosynthesis
LQNEFVLPGFVDEATLGELMADTDVFVMPSVSEPFGIVGAEAIAAGVPVVLSARCGLAELVPSAPCIDPEHPRAIGKIVVKLLKDPALRRDLVARAQAELAEVGWDRCARKVGEVYGRLAFE